MKHLQALSRRFAVAIACMAVVLALAFPAQASFTYAVAPATTSTNFGAGSNLTVTAYNGGATSAVLNGMQGINLAQINQSSTTVAPTDTALSGIPLAPLVVTINNQNGGGSGTFTVNGRIIVTRSDTGGAESTFTAGSITPASLILGSWTYTLSTPTYAAPTVGAGGNGNGSLSYLITESVVPEPASMALMGIGLVVVAGSGIRKMRSR
jgi:PEP-CTERM motif